jgi:hypothetical protein
MNEKYGRPLEILADNELHHQQYQQTDERMNVQKPRSPGKISKGKNHLLYIIYINR